eukprot:scaffold260675_cov18-Prasinocladus_malaysianus.AAC.2
MLQLLSSPVKEDVWESTVTQMNQHGLLGLVGSSQLQLRVQIFNECCQYKHERPQRQAEAPGLVRQDSDKHT